MKLRFTKDTPGICGELYKKGDVIEYHPWKYEWQGMTEKKRVEKGIFVHCYGIGEFEVYRTKDAPDGWGKVHHSDVEVV